MMYLSENKIKILENLAKYKFLTTKQFLRLGIVKHRPNIFPILKDLRDRQRPFIERISFAVHPKLGRLEDVYYLTKWGVKFLIEELGYSEKDIRYPIGKSTLFFRDYFHRLYTIDFHIEFDEWVNKNDYEINFFYTYFDKIGASRSKEKKLEALTKVKLDDENYILADAISMFETPKRKYLFCLEVYTDKNTKRVIKQLQKHMIALSKGYPSLQFNFNRGSRVISIFEDETTMKAVINRLNLNNKEEVEEFEEYFLFKTINQIKEDFFNHWFNLKLKERTFI